MLLVPILKIQSLGLGRSRLGLAMCHAALWLCVLRHALPFLTGAGPLGLVDFPGCFANTKPNVAEKLQCRKTEIAVQENKSCSAGNQKLQCRKSATFTNTAGKCRKTKKCSAGKVQEKCNIADKMQCNMFWVSRELCGCVGPWLL